jgi:hypothetical protein
MRDTDFENGDAPVFTLTFASGVPLRSRGSRSVGGGRRGPQCRAGVAGVGDHDDAHAAVARRQHRMDLVVAQRAGTPDVVRAQRLVEPVGLVALAIADIGAVARIRDDDEVTVRGAGERRPQRLDEPGLRRLRIEQRAHREAAGTQLGGPVLRVVDAAGQVEPRAGVGIDAHVCSSRRFRSNLRQSRAVAPRYAAT